jgi:hypothetical protein
MTRYLVSLVLALVTLTTPDRAAAQARLAEVSGTVLDGSGAVLPGVTVTATHVATQQARTTVTGNTGTYLFAALEVGVYEVRAELQGFRPVIFSNYRLSIGDSARLDIRMELATVEETVTVSGEAPLVERTKSDLAGRISETQMEQLPVNGRNWLTFASLAPGVKSDASGGQPTSGVGDGRMSKVYVDGGQIQNLSTVAVDLEVSKEIIGEFEVITNRFDAVMGRAGTTVVNAVTRSGTDKVSGSAFMYFRDDALNAKDFYTGRVEPYRNSQYGGTIGGPILRGKSHYFASYERQVEPKTLSSNTGIASIDAAVESTDTRNLYFGRIDHSLTNSHRFTVRFNRFDRLQPHLDVGGTRPLSNSHTNDFQTNRINFGVNSIVGNRFVNQFYVTYLTSFRQFNRFDGPPDRETFALAPFTNNQHVFPSVTIGGVTNVGNERPHFWHLRNDASYFLDWRGQHSIKFGGEWNHQYIHGIFAANSNGTFFYDEDPPNLANCCGTGDQSEWDKSQFPTPARYSQALGDFFYDAPNDIYGAYFQDDWTVHPRLTLNLGLRYDLEIGSLGHDQFGLVTTPHGNDVDNFQPRVGAAWDVLGTGKTILRGGGGLYYDQVFLNVTFNQRRANTGRQVSVTTFNTANDPGFARDPLANRSFDDFLSAAGAANVTRIAENSRQPHLWSWAGGIAQQIGPELAISADYVYQRSDSMLRSVDANLFCCLPDGSPLPIRNGTFPELGGPVTGGGRPDPRFNQITEYVSVGQSRYHGLQVGLNKRLSHNYQFGVSYLLSKNEDDHNGAFSLPNSPFNLADEYGRSLQDQRHRLVVNWVSQLPYGINFGGIAHFASGRAIGVSTGGIDINGDGATGGDRPTCGRDPRFNPGCTALGVADGQRVPKNALVSDPVYRADLRVSRLFRVRGITFDPSVEVFNVFNRKNDDPTRYNTNLANARFGEPGRSDQLPYLPRQMQVALRVTF